MSEVIAALVVVAVAGIPIRAWIRHRRRQRVAARRRVELPNSHYAPPAVVRRSEIERWSVLLHDESVHPVNRVEVERLLDLAEAAGLDALSDAQRRFLDTLLEGVRSAASPRPPAVD